MEGVIGIVKAQIGVSPHFSLSRLEKKRSGWTWSDTVIGSSLNIRMRETTHQSNGCCLWCSICRQAFGVI